MRLTVIGLGHLGLVHAACLAALGHEVLGIDTDPRRYPACNDWLREAGLPGILADAGDRLGFSTSLASARGHAEAHFLCLPTPVGLDGETDMRFLRDAVTAMGLDSSHLLIGKSTVPPGTVLPSPARLAWNPEFLREGLAVHDTLRPSRLVYGTSSPRDLDILREIYDPLPGNSPVFETDVTTAQAVKVIANAFLALKISFFNAAAALAPDPLALGAAVGADPRIGDWGTRPGLGFGGGCLPKDLRMAGRALAGPMGMAVSASVAVNAQRRRMAVSLAARILGSLDCARVAVLGLAFKPGTADVRDSPGLEIVTRLRAAHARVACHDPAARPVLAPGAWMEPTVIAACSRAQLVIVAADWAEYRQPPAGLAPSAVLDCRNGLDRAAWEAAGWEYFALDDDFPDRRERLPPFGS